MRFAIACAFSVTALLATACWSANSRGVSIDNDDIGGVVRSATGPEAGVWVIAETSDLPTRMAKMVVTDDQGRYVIPDLPRARYAVWVRGYGLVDSAAVTSVPGAQLDLAAVVAPDARSAAQYYPANYWLSLLEAPRPEEFPGTGPEGNGIPTTTSGQQHWTHWLTEKCRLCHQMGTKATREIPKANGDFRTSEDAWRHRLGLGVMGGWMVSEAAKMGPRGIEELAAWTDRIGAGALPPAPPRPSGVERNLVVSMWDWANGSMVHDVTSTARFQPTVNGGGRVYGVSQSRNSARDDANKMVWFDPKDNTVGQMPVPSQDPAVEPSPHNPMMDSKGRGWMTSAFRAPGKNPGFCTDAANPYARFFPVPYPAGTPRQLTVYDARTNNITMVETCSGTHHLQFARDDTLYLTGDIKVAAWLDTRIHDKTGDVAAATGWCPLVLDTNGNGTMDNWAEPDYSTPYSGPQQPSNPSQDQRIAGFLYGIGISPTDDSVWYALASYGADEQPPIPSGIVRMHRGDNPPQTCTVEYFEPPVENGVAMAISPRGVELDSQGVAWVGFASRIGRFDRRQCRTLRGPEATGQHCPEGWTFYDAPGPNIKNVATGSADHHYLSWVDLYDTLGMGKDIPIIPGTNSDSLLAVEPTSGKINVLRVPYPMGFYARGLDGRIDDAKAGWKGRAVWSNYAEVSVKHIEGGDGTNSKVVKFQVRPDPLAK